MAYEQIKACLPEGDRDKFAQAVDQGRADDMIDILVKAWAPGDIARKTEFIKQAKTSILSEDDKSRQAVLKLQLYNEIFAIVPSDQKSKIQIQLLELLDDVTTTWIQVAAQQQHPSVPPEASAQRATAVTSQAQNVSPQTATSTAGPTLETTRLRPGEPLVEKSSPPTPGGVDSANPPAQTAIFAQLLLPLQRENVRNVSTDAIRQASALQEEVFTLITTNKNPKQLHDAWSSLAKNDLTTLKDQWPDLGRILCKKPPGLEATALNTAVQNAITAQLGRIKKQQPQPPIAAPAQSDGGVKQEEHQEGPRRLLR